MFDITSSKLFLLAVVALLVIGPKDFPILLRTIGKYVGIIRGHAKEFRAQFDEAMRESELADLKKDMESIAHETEASLSATSKSVQETFTDARLNVEGALAKNPADSAPQPAAPDPLAHDATAPAVTAEAGTGQPTVGSAPVAAAESVAPAEATEAPPAAPAGHTAAAQPAATPVPERTGA